MGKPKVLVVEDNQDRIAWFKSKMSSAADLFITEAPEIAIEWLSKNTPALIFLDHDLGDEVYVNSGTNTGDQVAQQLQFMGSNGHNVILHTCNPIGAVNMKVRLPFAQVIPFPRLISSTQLEVTLHWLMNKGTIVDALDH